MENNEQGQDSSTKLLTLMETMLNRQTLFEERVVAKLAEIENRVNQLAAKMLTLTIPGDICSDHPVVENQSKELVSAINSSVLFWNSVTGESLSSKNLQFENSIKILHVIREHIGHAAMAVGFDTGLIILLNLWGSESARLIGHTDYVTGIAEVPNDPKLVSTAKNFSIRVWDLTTGSCLNELPIGTTIFDMAGYRSLQMLSDKTFAVGRDYAISILHVETGEVLDTLQLEYGTGAIYSMCLLADGKHLVTGSREIKVWNLETKECTATCTGHTLDVRALVDLQDGRIASCSDDSYIKIWDWKTGKCLSTLIGHSGCVSSLTRLIDGRLASGSSYPDSSIKIWTV